MSNSEFSPLVVDCIYIQRRWHWMNKNIITIYIKYEIALKVNWHTHHTHSSPVKSYCIISANVYMCITWGNS
jgi:hypothetical protein